MYMVAAGILPIAIHRGKLFFLFGKENPMEDSAKGWSDFGGTLENSDTPLETAIRECSEELTGFLGNPSQIARLVSPSKYYKVLHNNYHVYIIKLPEYDPKLPIYYNNNHSFLWNRMDKNMLNSSKLFEKIEIKWFSESELRTKRSKFRCFYREIVDIIREHIPQIKRQLCSSKTRRMHKTNKSTTRRSRLSM